MIPPGNCSNSVLVIITDNMKLNKTSSESRNLFYNQEVSGLKLSKLSKTTLGRVAHWLKTLQTSPKDAGSNPTRTPAKILTQIRHKAPTDQRFERITLIELG